MNISFAVLPFAVIFPTPFYPLCAHKALNQAPFFGGFLPFFFFFVVVVVRLAPFCIPFSYFFTVTYNKVEILSSRIISWAWRGIVWMDWLKGL